MGPGALACRSWAKGPKAGGIYSVPLWPSEESMHRWSPHCALGWLQAELEEAEQEAEVRGGVAGLGDSKEGDPTYCHRYCCPPLHSYTVGLRAPPPGSPP